MLQECGDLGETLQNVLGLTGAENACYHRLWENVNFQSRSANRRWRGSVIVRALCSRVLSLSRVVDGKFRG